MKKYSTILSAAALAATLHSGVANAGDAKAPVEIQEAPVSEKWDAHRPDSHAPIGVMGDHTHEAGEFMLSYRYHNMHMEGHRAGTQSLSSQQVFDLGYGVAAEEMDMHMHMFGLMYAPTDWLTLFSMLNYVEKDMEMVANPHAGHGHGAHGGHAHAGSHGHSSAGLGDTTIGGLIKIYDDNNQRVHINLGLVLPTAEVDAKQDGSFLPYGMQLGEGVFSLKPGLTYLGQNGRVSWGAQSVALVHLEDENDSGFRYGDGVNTTAWLAYLLNDRLSVSARLNYLYQEDISGHYNGAHAHSAPPHFQPNYGGHTLEGGLGVNYLCKSGLRLAAEALVPVYQDLNGVGMDRDWAFVLGVQKSF